MPLPPGVTTRTYTGTIVGLDGVAATGTLEFRQPKPIYDAANNVVVGPEKPITATVTTGAFTVQLPVSPWQYVVRIATDAIKDVYLLLVEAGATPLTFADTYLTAAPAELADFYVLRATFDALADRVTDLEETGGVSVPDATSTTKGVVRLAGDLAGTADAPTVPGLATKQPLDPDLTTISNLIPGSNDVLQYVSGAWANRTIEQLKTSLALTYADVTGTVPTSALPPLAINETFVVADQAAMLALTAQRGDMAIRQDNGRTYVLATDSPGTLADWKEVLAAGQVQSVAGKTGVVVLTKADVGLDQVDNTSDTAKPVSTAQQAALNGKVPLSLVDAAGDLLVGSGDNTLTRLAKGTNGQVLTVVAGALAYADPAGGTDPGDDILALYGFHTATSHISAFRSEFGQNNELWIGRVCVRAGRAITKIGTFVKTAGVLGVGGTNGFAIANDDGSALLFSHDADNLWETAGLVSVNLGGSAIPAQSSDTFYRIQLCVQGYSTAPIMLLNQGDHAVLSDYEGRARFANASAGFQGGGGYNPLTFGTSTGGFYPLIMLG